MKTNNLRKQHAYLKHCIENKLQKLELSVENTHTEPFLYIPNCYGNIQNYAHARERYDEIKCEFSAKMCITQARISPASGCFALHLLFKALLTRITVNQDFTMFVRW